MDAGRVFLVVEWAYPSGWTAVATLDLRAWRLFQIGRAWFQMTWVPDTALAEKLGAWMQRLRAGRRLRAYGGWVAGMTGPAAGCKILPGVDDARLLPLNGTKPKRHTCQPAIGDGPIRCSALECGLLAGNPLMARWPWRAQAARGQGCFWPVWLGTI